jgi:hypothetical protein
MADEAPTTPKWHGRWEAYIVGFAGSRSIAVFLLGRLAPRKSRGAAALLIAIAVWALTAGRYVARMHRVPDTFEHPTGAAAER